MEDDVFVRTVFADVLFATVPTIFPACTANIPAALPISVPPNVTFPVLLTLNFDEPPTCKSISFESAALAVSVILATNGENVTDELFHVCTKLMLVSEEVKISPVRSIRFTFKVLFRLILFALMFPLTSKELNVPILVIFGCALVVNDPVTALNTPLVAPIFPTLALPDTLLKVNRPLAAKFPLSLNNNCVLAPGAKVRLVAVIHERFPDPSVVKIWLLLPPVILTLPADPRLEIPFTVSPVRVPRLMTFG